MSKVADIPVLALDNKINGTLVGLGIKTYVETLTLCSDLEKIFPIRWCLADTKIDKKNSSTILHFDFFIYYDRARSINHYLFANYLKKRETITETLFPEYDTLYKKFGKFSHIWLIEDMEEFKKIGATTLVDKIKQYNGNHQPYLIGTNELDEFVKFIF